MADTKVYDSGAVDCIVCAIPIKDGLDDPFVTVTPVTEGFGTEVGVDGETVFYSNRDNTYDVTIGLMGSSSHNEQLSAIYMADRLSSSGAGIGVFLLKDGNGATIMASDRCRIMSLPERSFGKTPGKTSWKLRIVASPAGMVVGGN